MTNGENRGAYTKPQCTRLYPCAAFCSLWFSQIFLLSFPPVIRSRPMRSLRMALALCDQTTDLGDYHPESQPYYPSPRPTQATKYRRDTYLCEPIYCPGPRTFLTRKIPSTVLPIAYWVCIHISYLQNRVLINNHVQRSRVQPVLTFSRWMLYCTPIAYRSRMKRQFYRL